METSAQSRVWKKSTVRKELQAQLKIIEELDALDELNADTIQALRDYAAGLKCKAPARAKPKGPPALTNQTAFEQYRRFVESDLKGQVKGQPDPSEGSFLFAITYLGYWMGRYSRRLQTLNGSYGRLGDEQGQQAVVARNLFLDAQEKGIPDWDSEIHTVVDMCLKNNSQLKVLDAGTAETPHSYGPSLRRLWLEGVRSGLSALEAWNHVRIWASHCPTVWETENRRKNKGLAHSQPALADKLAQSLAWTRTDDPIYPWSTQVDDNLWRARVNDFPDGLMYSLFIGSEHVGDFHDWPETWHR